MSWPRIDLVQEWVDWSWYINLGPDYDHAPYDVDKFVDLNPNIEGIILRINWPRGGKDAHFTYYYDAFTRRKKKILIYFWSNPHLSIAQNKENWKVAVDGRKVYGAIKDVELHWNLSKAALTKHEREALEAADSVFGLLTDIYTRGYFWDDYIIHGSWVGKRKFIIAHYVKFFRIPNTDEWRQAKNHQEVNALLPIDNSFTPRLGNNIQPSQVGGWQFGEKGELPGTTSGSDLDYLKLAYVMSKFKEESGPGPESEPQPTEPVDIKVEVSYPVGRANVTLERKEVS